MQIVMDLSHVFSPDSPSGERAAVSRALDTCLDKVVRTYSREVSKVIPTQLGSLRGKMYVWDLPHVFNVGTDRQLNAVVLRALLDCLVDISTAYLSYHPDTPALYDSGVRYGRTKTWYPTPTLFAMQFGDCKSLTAALIAEYRMKGIDCSPVFRWVVNSHGVTDFHILVQTPHGFEDPSKVLGMGEDELSYFYR